MFWVSSTRLGEPNLVARHYKYYKKNLIVIQKIKYSRNENKFHKFSH